MSISRHNFGYDDIIWYNNKGIAIFRLQLEPLYYKGTFKVS